MIPTTTAALRRDDGILRAAAHNERVNDGWQDAAIEIVSDLAKRGALGETFLTERARELCGVLGLSAPTDGRAWGAVMQRLQREGVIEPAGYARARSSNLSPKVLWRVVR